MSNTRIYFLKNFVLFELGIVMKKIWCYVINGNLVEVRLLDSIDVIKLPLIEFKKRYVSSFDPLDDMPIYAKECVGYLKD